MFNRRKISIAFIALLVIGAGLYWRQPLAKATMNIVYGLSVQNGLVGYWNFDECKSCTTAADKSGNGNTGTMYNAAGPTIGDLHTSGGKIGNGVSLDGSDDYVDAGTAVLSGNTGAFSTSVWFKLNSNSSSKVIISKDDRTTGVSKKMFQIQTTLAGDIVSGSTLAGYVWDESAGIVYLGRMTTVPLNLGQWYHVAFTYDGGTDQNGVLLYLDGVQYTGNYSGGAFAGIDTTNANFLIGAFINSSGSKDRLFDGLIDELRIYNRALSAGEIKYLADQRGDNTIRSSNKNGLVGYWNFDECDSCTTAADKSGNGNTGTFQGNTVRTAGGRIQTGATFDGTADRINVTETASLQITGDITLAAWVKPTTVNSWMDVVSKGLFANDVYKLAFDPNAKILFRVRTASDNVMYSSGAISANVWTHIVGVRRGDTLYVYINGQQDATTLSVSGSGANVAGDVTIGAEPDNANPFSGDMDDVRIYNRALTADEITRLYEEGSYRTTINANQNSSFNNGLVGMWSFNGPDVDWASTTAEILDRSGNGNNGDATNFGKEAVRPGMVGQALSFDGADDYVSIGDSAVYNVGTNLTYAAWIKTTDTQGEIFSHFDATSPYAGTLFDVGFLDNNGKLEAWFCGDGSCPTSGATSARVADTGAAVNDGNWHHVSVTYDGTNARFYRDGILSSTIATTNSVGDSTNNLNIGRDTNTSPVRYLNGLIDELRIYNRALSAAEIQELYLSSARL